MKILLITITLLFGFTPHVNSSCGDGTVYANEKQVKYDDRFKEYPTIPSCPEYKDGDKKLDEYIRSSLKLNDKGKTLIFNLNYKFTITCEGKIKDFVQLGDPAFKDVTNIADVIQATEGSWKAAEKDGKSVDCIYFRKLFINGTTYK